MSLLHNLEEFTKEDLIIVIKKHDFKGHISRELPMIRFNRMCDESTKISDEAQEHMRTNNFKLAHECFTKSNRLYKKAMDLLEKTRIKND